MSDPANDPLIQRPAFEAPLEQLLNELSLGIIQLSLTGDVLHANAAAQAIVEGPGGSEVLTTLHEMTARALQMQGFVESVLSLGAMGELRVLVSPARCLDGCLAVLERGVINRLRAETNALRSMLAAASEAVSPTEAAHRALATLATTLAGSYLVIYELDEGRRLVRSLSQIGVPASHSAMLADRQLDDKTSLVCRVLQTGRPHHVANLARSFFPAERGLPNGEKLAALALPVRGRGRTVGALFICGPRDLLGEGELKLTQGLADALGALIERARQDAAFTSERVALKTLMDHLPDAVLEQDGDGHISAAGGRIEGLLGQPVAALLGQQLGQVLVFEDRSRFEAAFANVTEGPVTGEFTVERPDGTRLPCEVSAHVSRVDGRGLKIRAIFRDISGRVALQQQVEASQQRAIRSDRLAAIGQLAAGVAHEINNPLAFVKSNISAQVEMFSELRDALPNCPPQVLSLIDELEQISRETTSGVDRIASIVKQLKLQSRDSGNAITECDVGKAVNEAVLFFSKAKGRRDAVDCELPSLPRVHGDPGRLGQVIMNLLENALDAMGGEGTIKVRGSTDGTWVRLTVTDQGPGIPASVRDHIFEPFFTTKGIGKGTGLGLHISHQIIGQAGGKMTFDTGPGGTTFLIELPCVAQLM